MTVRFGVMTTEELEEAWYDSPLRDGCRGESIIAVDGWPLILALAADGTEQLYRPVVRDDGERIDFEHV